MFGRSLGRVSQLLLSSDVRRSVGRVDRPLSSMKKVKEDSRACVYIALRHDVKKM
jgi:hypothetical protein